MADPGQAGAWVVQGTAAGGEDLAGNPYFSNVLHAGGGNGDTLRGGAAADTLHDDGGRATLIGGAGGDSYYISGDDDVLLESPSYGRDTVYASGDYSLGAEIEDLVLLDGLTGLGNAESNRITGNAGDNILAGRGGADTLKGGASNDHYIVYSALDVVVEAAGERPGR